MPVSSGEWTKFLKESQEWYLLQEAMKEQVEQWRNDLENGNALDRDAKPISDDFIRGQLSGLRFAVALPTLLKEETEELEKITKEDIKEALDGRREDS